MLAINANRQMPDVRVFEVGNVFAPHRPEDGDRPAHEELSARHRADRSARAAAPGTGARDRVDVYDAKGLAELALAAAGVTDAETSVWPAEQAPRVPRARAPRPAWCDGRSSSAGSARWRWRSARCSTCPRPVFVAELSLTALAGLPIPVADATSRCRASPPSSATWRSWWRSEVIGGRGRGGHPRAWPSTCSRASPLFDVYTGGQVGAGRRSLAWSLTFQAPDRTLTDAEVNRLHERVVAEIAKRFRAEVRGA